MPKAMSYHARRADREIREARAAIEENKEEATRRLTERWVASHPDKTPPDFLAFQDWLLESMAEESAGLFSVDGEYIVVVNERTKSNRRVRKARDGYEDQMRFERNGIRVNYGDDVTRELGLGDEPERDRYMALAQGKGTIRQFDALDFAEITPLPGRASLDLSEVQSRLTEKVDGLESAVDEHDKRKKEVEAKRGDLLREVADYRSSYSHFINIERGLLNLAGLDEVARRLRPPKRRRTRTRKDETPPEPPPADSPQGTGETPSADPTP